MTDRRLSDQVKEFYAKEQPRDGTLARLLAQHDAITADTPMRRGRTTRTLAASVAFVTLAAALLWSVVTAPDWVTLAAREVALNHRKDLAPEFKANDYDVLRAAMRKLDFVLIAPQHLPEPGLRVTGARYCSIQGHLAAQIKLRDAQGIEYTLYQTHLKPNADASPAEREFVIDGVRIWQWYEGGLLFAFARSME
jgi:hypothetical protein